MIKIIQGTYGHCVRKEDKEGKIISSRVFPKTPADKPFTITPEQEQRLVSLGVALYVDEQQEDPDAPPALKTQPKGKNTALPEYNEEMKLDELKDIAEAYGVDASGARKKADVIKMIEASKSTDEEIEEDDDEEDPPVLEAAPPVVE